MGNILFNYNPILEQALNGSWLRNQALSNNIANVNTPGYIRQDVNFQDYLKAAMNKDAIVGMITASGQNSTNEASSDTQTSNKSPFGIIQDYSSTAMRADGNNVDIDKEMSELAKNQILFNSFAEMLNKNFSMTMSAIREGR